MTDPLALLPKDESGLIRVILKWVKPYERAAHEECGWKEFPTNDGKGCHHNEYADLFFWPGKPEEMRIPDFSKAPVGLKMPGRKTG